MEDPKTSRDKTRQTSKPKPGHRQRTENLTTSNLFQHRREVKGIIPRTVVKVVTNFRGKKQRWLLHWTRHTAWPHHYSSIVSSISNSLQKVLHKFPTLLKLLTYQTSVSLSHFKFLIENRSHPNSLKFLSPALWIPPSLPCFLPYLFSI